MKVISFWLLLTVSFSLILAGCSTEETAEPAIVGEETSESPAQGSGTTPAEGSGISETPTEAEEGSGAVEGEKSTATKTGEAVGGALRTAGEATEKGVKTGVDASVKGAKATGKATKDVVEGAAEAIKGDEKKN